MVRPVFYWSGAKTSLFFLGNPILWWGSSLGLIVVAVILAVVFLAIGLGDIISWQCILPGAVIAIGLYLLVTGFLRQRE